MIHSDSTEITEIKEGRSPDRPGPAVAGETAAPWNDARSACRWIFYDGECQYCIDAARRFKKLFARHGFHFVPLQTGWVQKRLGLTPGASMEEMRVLTRDGYDLGGGDAVIFLAGKIWWTSFLPVLARLPGVHRTIDRAYRWVAAHRECSHVDGRDALCGVPLIRGTRQSSSLPIRIVPWLGLFFFPTLALLTRGLVAPWMFMWLMAGALFFGCKWLTFWRAKQRYKVGAVRALGYLFLWAGMDAPRFLDPHQPRTNRTVELRRSTLAVFKIVFGTALLFGLARLAPNGLLAGWIGMIGMILILHFGLFDLAAAAWRMIGVDAKPIMNAPMKSHSLNEFWGRRWNGAFNQLVLSIFFRQLVRSVGTIRATLTAFLISGLIHELVISLPAAAGYGLPTAYFLLQGWGVIAQRSVVGNQLALRRGVTGRVFTIAVAAGPAFWLFHPPFVRNVVLPFLKAIGAL